MMTIAELGELGLIARVALSLKQTLAPGVIGIGDDCAMIPQDEQRALLVTTDLLTEGVHFLKDKISPEDLGHKALAVNLSDIAAMGGKPTAAFLSVALPSETSTEWFDLFLKGLTELAHRFDVKILGGDTTGSQSGITINITALGEIATNQAKLRSTATRGDKICVVGNIGDSAAGLKLSLSGVAPLPKESRALLRAHHRPEPLIVEGRWLARQMGVHAMMDLSDGLDSDLRKLLQSSNVKACVQLDQLPLSAELRSCAQDRDWDAINLAVSGGEDYGLLVTVDAETCAQIAKEFKSHFDVSFSVIGEITGPASQNAVALTYLLDGRPATLTVSAFDHFNKHS